MPHVLLVPASIEKGPLLRQQILEAYPSFSVRLAESAEQLCLRVPNGELNLLILCFTDFRERDLVTIEELRNSGYQCPILVLCRHAVRRAWFQASSFPGVFVLEEEDLRVEAFKMLSKLATNSAVMQRTHKRFATEQKARIECFSKGAIMESILFNLSRGGAYLECTDGETVNVFTGDYVRLDIELDQLDRRHRMHAKVVWTTEKGPCRGRFGVGVEFLKADEIYKYLIGQI